MRVGIMLNEQSCMAYFIGKERRKILFETHFSTITIFYIYEKVPAEITVDEKLPYKEEIKIALVK